MLKSVKRRQVLLAAAGGTGVLLLGEGLRRSLSRASATPEADRPVEPAVRELFGTLGPGSRFEQWRLVSLHALTDGAIPVVLETNGAHFQVDILRDDPAGPSPVAKAGGLALFISNQGNGQRTTDELQGLGAMALAKHLEAQETKVAKVEGLLTFAQREEQHPRGLRSVL